MKPFRLSTAATGFQFLTSLKGNSSYYGGGWHEKDSFQARSSGLHKFTCMPFGLSNTGSSFYYLMEQCLGDQKFVTLLLYLNNIGIFALSIGIILDNTELVFNRLKAFHLKIKQKKCHSLTAVFYSGAMRVFAEGILTNSWESGKGEGLAVPHKCKGGAFLPRTCDLLSLVYS